MILGCACLPAYASTWYVRTDGGTRYSTNVTSGQCDGLADAPYPGTGVNRHCAFKDVRMLWEDGTYASGTVFPAWGWVGQGGDTYIIKGSIQDGVSYRVGPNITNKYDGWGIAGNPYSSGAPSPPSGTPSRHTRVLGGNYASCHNPLARTQLHGGGAVFAVLSMYGASYVDVACLDITDFSSCGTATQKVSCDANQDFAKNGIMLSNTSTHDTLTDIRIHGLASFGIFGSTGDGVVMDYVDMIGNAGGGWNADASDGKTGKGSLLVTNYNISWNGCAEEYPLVHPIPYGDCTDQDHGGYGDGFGTATQDSEPPGWQVHFDNGVVSYNTQDGLDALHIGGKGSSMTVTRTLAFSNMGQQIKVGGATATITDSLIVGNCDAMKHDIPGTPPGFNTRLDLFCRAGDTAVVIMVPDAQPAIYQRNIMYSDNHVGLEIEYPGNPTPNAAIRYDHNIFIGFPNSEHEYPSPIFSSTDLKMFTNPGASFSDNDTYHAKSSWQCPATWLHERNGSCSDPHLKDETWHPYGYGDATPTGATDKKDTSQSSNMPGPQRHLSYGIVAASSIAVAGIATGVWKGLRHPRNRSNDS